MNRLITEKDVYNLDVVAAEEKWSKERVMQYLYNALPPSIDLDHVYSKLLKKHQQMLKFEEIKKLQ